MHKPILVVMAAGMGSRYGGLKQLDPVGPHGQLIIDYSIYDARRAGFETVVFIVKRELEEAFHAGIGRRVARGMDVRYACQDMADLPAGFTVPEGRVKPWGTAHAVLAARHIVDAPFAVINADDCYGPEGFQAVYGALCGGTGTSAQDEYAMVGYLLKNTVTENGYVARGVCETDENGFLTHVTERTHIEKRPDGIAFTEDGGQNWVPLADDTIVSMNLWGFTHNFLREAEARFPVFLEKTLRENPLKGEYFVPDVVSALIREGKARVRVLQSHDTWYGVTYQADKPAVMAAIAEKTARGEYPEQLWGM